VQRYWFGIAALLVLPQTASARDVLEVGAAKTYTSISDALAAASDGDRIVVEAGTWNECLQIPAGMGVELVAATSTHPTLICGSQDATHAIQAEGDLILDGFTIRHARNGGGITASGNSLVVHHSAFETLNATSAGAGIHSEGAEVFLSETTFDECHSSGGNGGAVWVKNADLTLVDVEVNTASADMGGAFSVRNGDLTGVRVVVDDADATTGGVIYMEVLDSTDRELFLRDSTLQNNEATSAGGAIYSDQAKVKLTGTNLSSNRVLSGTGGAIWTNGDLKTHASTFYDNSAVGSGGAVYANMSNSTFRGTTFSTNKAESPSGTAHGGAIFQNGGELRTEDCDFTSNTTFGWGGAIRTTGPWYGAGDVFTSNSATFGGAVYSNSEITVHQDDFSDNSAGQGGALYAVGTNQVFHGSRFYDNDADYGGAVLAAAGSGLTLNGALIALNAASVAGGGVFAGNGVVVELVESKVISNTASGGGGLASVSSAPDASAGIHVQRTLVRYNTSDGVGGGYWLLNGKLDIQDSWFFHNQSTGGSGGGIHASSPAGISVQHSIFCRNQAANDGGAIFASEVSESREIFWTVFQENTSTDGRGGAYFEEGTAVEGSLTTIVGVTVAGNQAEGPYGGVVADYMPPNDFASQFDIYKSIFQANGSSGIATVDAGPGYGFTLSVFDTHFGEHSGRDINTMDGLETQEIKSDQDDDAPYDPLLPLSDLWLRDQICTNDDLTGQWVNSTGETNNGAALWAPMYLDDDDDGVPFAGVDCSVCAWTGDCIEAGARSPDLDEVPGNEVDEDCHLGANHDADDDGYVDEAIGGGDCDPDSESVNPLAYDTPNNAVDEDCSGEDQTDGDGDTFASADECADGDAGIHPLALESFYDGTDQDCTGSDWDADLDGYDHVDNGGGDCEDFHGDAHPGGVEVWYDGIDGDCDGANDFDQDGDDYVHEAYDAEVGGTAPYTGDCDDTFAATYPDAPEITDGEDNTCDGIDNADQDSDGDGVLDYWENYWGTDPNDDDWDNDGLTDGNEWGPDEQDPWDTDGDGLIDARDPDSDGDAVPDSDEVDGDTDQDSLPDARDDDDDGDGIPTYQETDGTGAPIDNDGDGAPDYLDTDSDNDGSLDIAEGTADSDGDGLPDYRDNGSDADEEYPPQSDPERWGFGCQSMPTAPNAAWLALLMLVGLRRKRNAPPRAS